MNKLKEIYKRNRYIYYILRSKWYAKRQGFMVDTIVCHQSVYNLFIKSIFIKKGWDIHLSEDDYIFTLFGLKLYSDEDCKKENVFLINSTPIITTEGIR